MKKRALLGLLLCSWALVSVAQIPPISHIDANNVRGVVLGDGTAFLNWPENNGSLLPNPCPTWEVPAGSGKTTLFQKALWSQEAIDTWFEVTGMQLPDSVRTSLGTDWKLFLDTVIRSSDRDSYISSCTDEAKKLYTDLIYKNAKNLLDRYRVELMAHATQQNKNDDTVKVTKPVVSKIYIMSNNYAK